MADPVYLLKSEPGVRRDGTDLDAPYFNDVVWTRFQRGKARKIGGYRSMSASINGPSRAVLVDSRSGTNSAHFFSQWGVQRMQFSSDGSASAVEDRTPAGFTPDERLNWSHGTMYSSTGGTYSAVIASSSPDVNEISTDTGGFLYSGNITSNDPLLPISDGSGPIQTSGGICVLQPFLFVYGSNGLIRNSNANDFSTATGWTTGGANLAVSNNVAATKIVYGAPVRGGSQAPAGLFWGLDSIVRVALSGTSTIWQYDTLACPTTILSKRGVVEHEGKFFWPGLDRFMMYNGVVQEVPNQMNSNYFFEGINWQYANKIWGTRVARFGEIWWFYPRGTDTECGNAVIFNYRENTWYDAVCSRTAGATTGISSVFRFPTWAGHEDAQSTTLLGLGALLTTSAATLSGSAVLTFTSTAGVVVGMVVSGAGVVYGSTVASLTATTVTLSVATTGTPSMSTLAFTTMTAAFAVGSPVTGVTSGAVGTATRVQATNINVVNVTGTFVSGETINGIGGATAVLRAVPVSQTLVSAYQHESGVDKVVGQNATAIRASFTTQNFGFAIGDPFDDAPKTLDMLTRITRLEPDFNQSGAMTVEILGRSFAQDADQVLASYPMQPTDSFQNMREQSRIMKLRFTSNVQGGFFEQGQTQVSLEPGDERSTK